MGANARSTAVVAPEIVFKRIGIVCVVGMAFIFVSARPHSPLIATEVALATMTLASLALARMTNDSLLRAALIVLLALLAAPLGYYFGPNSAFAAVLTILLVITGLLSARQPGRRSKIGWMVMFAICAGQLAIVILVSYGVLEDRSLAPVMRAGQKPWQNVAAQLATQGVFVCAFFAGRAAQKRYRQIVLDALDASRNVAIREALLDEARADYERALRLQARAELPTAEHDSLERTTNPIDKRPERTEVMTADPMTREVAPKPRPSMVVVDDGTQGRWSQALQSKLRLQDAFVLGACLIGVYFSATVVHHELARNVSLVGIIAIAAMVAARAVLHLARPTNVVTWPYPVIAFLSAAPAYGFGLHAAFAGVVAMVLFTGRLFRSPEAAPTRHATNVASMWAVCISHGTMFTLIMSGVLPDASNLPLKLPGYTWYGPILHHVMVQGVYIVAFLAGGRIDREFVRAAHVAREAYAEVVRVDTRLQIARSELDAALKTEGLFSGTSVGPYQLGRLLGRGGMGEVYQAEGSGRRVALKVLRADRLGDPVALERFAHEANLLKRIDSRFCAKVLDVAHTAGANAMPYLAMEFVDGPSLSLMLRERGRLEGEDLVALVDDLARGLGDVHAAGVVHLDLKPSNVLRDKGARWKIVDFGIARMLSGEAHRKVAGTPPYMAPEQALGEPLDARTDLYSLSLILYRAITGRPAYAGADSTVIAERARTIGPPDPRETVTLDDDIVIALRIGLAAKMTDRFADAAELRNAFIGALGGRLDPRIRARGRDLLARAPWAAGVALVSAPRDRIELSSLRST